MANGNPKALLVTLDTGFGQRLPVDLALAVSSAEAPALPAHYYRVEWRKRGDQASSFYRRLTLECAEEAKRLAIFHASESVGGEFRLSLISSTGAIIHMVWTALHAIEAWHPNEQTLPSVVPNSLWAKRVLEVQCRLRISHSICCLLREASDARIADRRALRSIQERVREVIEG